MRHLSEKLENGKERTILSLKSHLSPIKAAVIPLKRNNQDLVDRAIELKSQLAINWFRKSSPR